MILAPQAQSCTSRQSSAVSGVVAAAAQDGRVPGTDPLGYCLDPSDERQHEPRLAFKGRDGYDQRWRYYSTGRRQYQRGKMDKDSQRRDWGVRRGEMGKDSSKERGQCRQGWEVEDRWEEEVASDGGQIGEEVTSVREQEVALAREKKVATTRR
ncbi:hypothetical protein ACLOJK_024856 [Asimina triloba]